MGNRLAASLGWPAADVQSWLDGAFTFDVERASQIAKALQLDVPMFVGKALEVTLRSPRDWIAMLLISGGVYVGSGGLVAARRFSLAP